MNKIKIVTTPSWWRFKSLYQELHDVLEQLQNNNYEILRWKLCSGVMIYDSDWFEVVYKDNSSNE